MSRTCLLVFAIWLFLPYASHAKAHQNDTKVVLSEPRPGTAFYSERPCDTSPTRTFFERPPEEVKADILSVEDLNNFLLSKFALKSGRVFYEPILHKAVIYSTPEIVEFLLDNGADLDCHGGGKRALSNAILFGRFDNVKILLKYGADSDLGSDPVVVVKLVSRAIARYISFIGHPKASDNALKHLGEDSELRDRLRKQYREDAEGILKLLIPIGNEESLITWKQYFADTLQRSITGEPFSDAEIELEWQVLLDSLKL